ncbi:MAG TPA: TIGR02206 family membrane protein [Candidatus Dormibacteraeota bacterium]|nr:TIGR02206 family membrane protein [Candidatus Dormibacteraeota bacterium]
MDLSAEHLITVAVILAAITILVAAARLRPGRWTEVAAHALALLIVVNEVGWWVWAWQASRLSLQNNLPLFLCDVAAFVAAAALITRAPLLVEVTYFWGIAGTANGIISPDIGDHFPSYPFFQYFIQHGAIPAAALFLVVGLRIYPRPWAAVRVFALSVVLVVVDAFANLLTDGNYMFLRTVPPGANLLDLFGPWPWYIFGGALLTVVFFAALDAPFRISALSRARSRTSPYPRPASPPSPRPRPGR